MAEAPGGGCQLPIPRHQADEVLALDLQQVGWDRGTDRRRARRTAEQCHLAEGLSRPELGQAMAAFAAALHDVDLAASDDIEGVALIAGVEDHLPCPEAALHDQR